MDSFLEDMPAQLYHDYHDSSGLDNPPLEGKTWHENVDAAALHNSFFKDLMVSQEDLLQHDAFPDALGDLCIEAYPCNTAALAPAHTDHRPVSKMIASMQLPQQRPQQAARHAAQQLFAVHSPAHIQTLTSNSSFCNEHHSSYTKAHRHKAGSHQVFKTYRCGSQAPASRSFRRQQQQQQFHLPARGSADSSAGSWEAVPENNTQAGHLQASDDPSLKHEGPILRGRVIAVQESAAEPSQLQSLLCGSAGWLA
ncbi:hypothetical protein WJX74_004465 [Apatococcus lobatus]|uniref:Uncharacterized protein n=1 Tax=Apatococcus lobatus TaxID=904363 RepID=A0AAW1RVH1_9CHLO